MTRRPTGASGADGSQPTWLVTLGLFLVTCAVNLQAPLYPTYAAAAHVGNGVSALAFSAYVAGAIPTLILLGGVSDSMGRKPVLLAALCCSLAATVLMIAVPTMHALFAARTLQGLAVGLGLGTGSAYLVELAPSRAEVAPIRIARATALGFGGGALATAVTSRLLPGATPASYSLVAIAIAATMIAITVALPGLPARGGPLVHRPQFPPGSLSAGLAVSLAWTVSGFVIAIVPARLRLHGLELWVGPTLFLVNTVGVTMQPAARRLRTLDALRIGFVVIPAGALIMIAGTWLEQIPIVLVGAGIAGAACYGFTYLGGLRRAQECMRPSDQRARVVSGYFLFAYLGLSVPNVAVGFLADSFGTADVFVGLATFLVAASLALAVALRRT
jgi:MFS family permease